MKLFNSSFLPRRSIVALIAIFVALAACTGSNSIIPSPALNHAPTVEAVQVQGTATSIPPTPLPAATATPTASPPPPLPVPPAATRLNFVNDATSGSITEKIRAGQVLNYVLYVAQGQPLNVILSSTNGDATMTIVTAAGGPLLDGGQTLNVLLNATEDYYISVQGGASTENFTLSVSTPARIQIASGETSVTLSGVTAGGFTLAPARGADVSYVFFGNEGQQINLNLNGVAKDGALAMYGFRDGQPYLRDASGQTAFSMKLPSSQDYIIQVVPRAGMLINYTLVVTVQ
ncbi:MAG TPA: hypothetical protein VLZ89_01035 [Anaerolineales bacterium]|nr:hypothetical protein [Anaerolineales bacterium]